MAQPSSTYRYSLARPTPVRSRRKRLPRLRRLLLAVAFLAALFLGSRTYLLNVYAPTLKSEAGSIPVLVQTQLEKHRANYVSLSAVSPYMQNAIVAIEDRRFYSHPGVDPLGMLRALWVNLTAQHIDQGGSTLEEQLVKRSIVLSDSSFHNKARTIALAWAVDQVFPKWKILELYLNAAYYGQGAYGVEDAARTYFGVDAAHLTLAESAFLSALPQAPSVYGAQPNAPSVMARKNTALEDMRQLGYISDSQAQAAARESLTFTVRAS